MLRILQAWRSQPDQLVGRSKAIDGSQSWRRISYGLYVEDREPCGLADQLRAWSRVLPKPAAFIHLTAAEVRGWWLPQTIAHLVFAALREGDPCPHRAGLFVSRQPSRVPTELVSGIRVTSAAESLLAAARDLGVLDLVLMGDSALRLGHCTIGELAEAATQRRRGAPMLRRVIGMLDKRSESPWESVMRILHRAAEIPLEPQHEVFDQWGRFVARGDHGSRGAVLRRSEPTRFSSASDDEVGGFPARSARSERSERSNQSVDRWHKPTP